MMAPRQTPQKVLPTSDFGRLSTGVGHTDCGVAVRGGDWKLASASNRRVFTAVYADATAGLDQTGLHMPGTTATWLVE